MRIAMIAAAVALTSFAMAPFAAADETEWNWEQAGQDSDTPGGGTADTPDDEPRSIFDRLRSDDDEPEGSWAQRWEEKYGRHHDGRSGDTGGPGGHN